MINMKNFALLTALIFLTGCNQQNSKPTYGETGLPKNCRAIVQASIDSWKKGEYPVDQIMDSLERNCGANGHSWDE